MSKHSLIQQLLEQSTERNGEAVVLIHGDTHLTYAQLEAGANQLASCLLDRGVKPGDRIGLLANNGVEYVTGFFGILKAGACVVALNGANRSGSNRALLVDCGAVGLVTQAALVRRNLPELVADNDQIRFVSLDRANPAWQLPDRCEVVTPDALDKYPVQRPSVALSAEALGAIFYTSGSTGKPRGVTLTHRNLIANTQQILDYLNLTPSDSVLVVLPFHYSFGNSLLLTHIQVGGSLVIDNRFAFPQTVVDTMVQQQVTGFSGVPSTYAILEAKTELLKPGFLADNLPSLRYFTQAGGAMSPALTRRIHDILPPQARLFVMYGQTEASARLAYVPPEKLVEKFGSIGIGIPGVSLAVRQADGTQCAVGEIGEIVASGDNIMQGYWGDNAETSLVLRENKEGQISLHTGDLARCDDDGFIFIVDRIKNMIKAGGNRVSAKEIEETIAEVAGVSEVCVVGVPDQLLGEAIEAFVVLRSGANVDEKAIQSHCHDHLAVFKIPRKIHFLAELPRSAAGKIIKSQLLN